MFEDPYEDTEGVAAIFSLQDAEERYRFLEGQERLRRIAREDLTPEMVYDAYRDAVSEDDEDR